MKPTIYLDSEEKVLSVVIHGDLISTLVREFHEEIELSLAVAPGTDSPWKTLSLNLIAAKMVDSMGLNLIVTLYKKAQKLGAKVQIIYADPNVHRTFLFTRLDQRVELIKA